MPGKERKPKNVVQIIPKEAKTRLYKPQTYVVSASFGKGCYRHIRISDSDTLENLHGAILDAFGFADDHAHAFFLDNRLWSDADSYYSSVIEDADRFTKDFPLDRVGLRPGMAFKYVFDFGQEWIFQLKLLSVLEEPTNAPQVIRSVGEAPLQYGAADEAEESTDAIPAFPEIYSSRQLKALYKSLALPAETAALLHRYFDAFAQLYGILPLHKALAIYNQQNEPLDEQSFAAFSEIVRHERHYYSILGSSDLYGNEPGPDAPMDREIIEESLLIDEEGYPEMKAAQRGKPYYIPAKCELLRYADEHYYEKNDAFMALREFLLQHMKLPLERAEDIADELQLHASTAESNMQYIIDDMERMGLEFKGLEDLQLFLTRFTEMANHTRMPINRGHTPMELNGKIGAPRSIQLGPGISDAVRRGEMDIDELRRGVSKMNFPNLDMQISYFKELERIEREMGVNLKVPEAPAPKVKVGRNEPCPCGSGKKYKHCCGKNH